MITRETAPAPIRIIFTTMDDDSKVVSAVVGYGRVERDGVPRVWCCCVLAAIHEVGIGVGNHVFSVAEAHLVRLDKIDFQGTFWIMVQFFLIPFITSISYLAFSLSITL